MQITFINFNNLKLDFSNSYWQTIKFNYKGSQISFNLYVKGEELFIYQTNFIIAKVKVNQIIKTTKFDCVFCQTDFTNDDDLSLDTIFTKYKLGIIQYV